MSLSTLKKSNSLDKLLGAVQAENAPKRRSPIRMTAFWKPAVDKRVMAMPLFVSFQQLKVKTMPWAKVWNHAFQGPTGQWYIENSLTTIGQNDPVSEMNSAYWNSGVESDKEIARRQKRKLQYFANILVVEDPANPQNEGKVMLYRFGKKIFDKCMEAMQPAFEDETPVNPFDFWEGANFKLKIRKVDGYWNYDKSEFAAPSAVFDDDEQIEEVWKKQYPLSEFTGASNFKSYEELKTRMNTVLAGTTTVGTAAAAMEDAPWVEPKVDTKPAPAPTVDKDDEDTMSYFEKLANE